MSDKPMKTDDPGDPRVSAAYRELADERSPEHLDHIILNAARGAARPRWNKAIAWLRPAAWVATIGVCLAIVVEISLLQDEEVGELDSMAPGAIESPVATPAAETKRLEKADRQTAEPAAVQPAQKPSRGRSGDLREQSDEDEVSNQVRELRLQEAVVKDEVPASLLRSAPAPASAQELATELYCDESQTADPNTWLECILELERQGLHEAARLERERLTEAFPPPMIR
jgi:hypothetical protein